MRKTLYSAEQAAFTAKLVKLRKAAKLTQRDLAKRLRRHHSVIGKVESGERRLDVVEFIAWCDALGCDSRKVFSDIRNEIKQHHS